MTWRRRLRTLGVVVWATVFVLLFNIIGFSVLLMVSPALGVVWSALLGTAVVLWVLRDDEGRRKRLAHLRLRPPRASRRWVWLAVGASLAVLWGLTGIIGWSAPPMNPDALERWEPILLYFDRPGAWLAGTVLLAVTAPLVEEIAFRGYVQRTLERRWGPAPAIVVTALVFTVAHFGRPHWSILLIPLTLGLANGVVVWLSRSLWPAVVIHMLWNLFMSVGELSDDVAADGTVPAGAVVLHAVALVAGVAVWIRLARARHAREGRPGARPR